MSGTGPITKRIQTPAPFGNVLDESTTLRRVGDNGGLAGASNALYRRGGAYGSRPGRLTAYSNAGTISGVPTQSLTATRWYRQNPTPLTQTIVGATMAGTGGLFWGGNPNTSAPPALTNFATGTTAATWPVSYAPAFDPVTNKDILIICGGNGFAATAPGYILIEVVGVPAAGTAITHTITNAAAVPTVLTYTTTPADTLFSIAQQLATLFNNSNANFAGTGAAIAQAVAYQSLATGAVISLVEVPALNVAQASGTIAVTAGGSTQIILAGGTIVGPGTSANFGTTTSTRGPKAWDGANFGAVSLVISAFGTGNVASITTGTPATSAPQACATWHNHVWYWGADAASNYLWASDINQPQNCSFMIQNGPYVVGAGDGDPGILAVVPLGNILYIFKRHNIYAMTGYDFQQGEYAFNLQPAIVGEGVPGPGCVSLLNNALAFWNGSTYRRLSPGALVTEDIGLTIALTEGSFTPAGGAKWVQSLAGSFIINTDLSNQYTGPAPMTLNHCSYFIMGTGGAGPTNMMMYDDDASQYLGGYAWNEWTLPASPLAYGLMQIGGGLDSTLTNIEPPELFDVCWATPSTITLNQIGASATTDNGAGITTKVITGYLTGGTPALLKELHQFYLEVSATTGVQINITVNPSAYKEASGIPSVYPPQTSTLFTTVNSTGGAEQYQVLLGTMKPFLRANAFQFVISWTTAANQQCEIVGLTLDFGEANFTP